MTAGDTLTVWAPGRVNLIGDHTDYVGGPVLPMAIDLGITLVATPTPGRIRLTSHGHPEPLDLRLPVDDPASVQPFWGRFVAAVAAELGTLGGLTGHLSSTLPEGSGLSSSAALEVASALALGAEGSATEVAELARRAEHRATGVPCGIMDQLACAGGVEGHALLIDCHTLSIRPVPVSDEVAVSVIHSGEKRSLASSAYAERLAQCRRAEEIIGPLRLAGPGAEAAIDDPVVRRRARHVISECRRVVEFADALADGRFPDAGRLMVAGHRSLSDDYDVSTPALDALALRLTLLPGVHGARLTGAGFGGCVVALHEPSVDLGGWRVRASGGAHRG